MTGTAVSSGWARDILPFVVMCVGMFIALLDIQIVASSLQDIGGGQDAIDPIALCVPAKQRHGRRLRFRWARRLAI